MQSLFWHRPGFEPWTSWSKVQHSTTMPFPPPKYVDTKNFAGKHCRSAHVNLHVLTEVLWCSSARRRHQIPTGPVHVGDTHMLPVRTVRDLGVYIDADVTISAHVTAVVKAYLAALRQICSVRRSLTRTTLLTCLLYTSPSPRDS